jgi:hypothetical protein
MSETPNPELPEELSGRELGRQAYLRKHGAPPVRYYGSPEDIQNYIHALLLEKHAPINTEKLLDTVFVPNKEKLIELHIMSKGLKKSCEEKHEAKDPKIRAGYLVSALQCLILEELLEHKEITISAAQANTITHADLSNTNEVPDRFIKEEYKIFVSILARENLIIPKNF